LGNFSIVIAMGKSSPYVEKCVRECCRLPEAKEIFVVPDGKIKLSVKDKRVRMIPSGKVGPGQKRDLAARKAAGEFLAFIDDDAYPSSKWLSSAQELFSDPAVAGVGGPAVTPREDSFLQRASGLTYSSPLCSGGYDFRYVPRNARDCDDIPTVNLIVRKSDFDAVGGFDTKFWPGEDTKLCLDLVHKRKKRLVYSPDVLVYHHRRPLFAGHLRQVSNYALHRGFFAKKFPQTSLRPSYFLPSVAVLGALLLLGLGFANPLCWLALLALVALHMLVSFLYGLSNEGIAMGLFVAFGSLLTHAFYGTFFLLGLLLPRLRR
jgi:cellulose synthase/poly-beta-1,6-N-acetylglucosamine synthase-like glycosyltransferase